jgi:predicted nucleic acid-binding protein
VIVVADTSPLHYLVLIDEVHVLPALYGTVIVPKAVLDELLHSGTPPKVREWANKLPLWIEVCRVGKIKIPSLLTLDIGEMEALQLAMDLAADIILIDETDGRKQAELLHLQVRGTLRVLEDAAKMGKTNFHRALLKLQPTSFRMSSKLLQIFLERNP